MELNGRTVITHLSLLAVGLAGGIFLAKRGDPPPSGKMEVSAPEVIEESGKPRVARVTLTPKKSTGAAEPPATADGEGADSKLVNLRNHFVEQLNKGEFRQALLILQEMERSAPGSRAFFESNGDYQVAQREWEALKANAKKCIAAFPQSRICLRHLASAEIQVGSKEDQVSTVNACLAIEPNDPDCRHMSGQALMNSGDFSAAVSVYEKLLRDNGNYGVRFPDDLLEMQLGLALDGAGRPDEAMTHLENACRLNNEQACQKIEEIGGGE